MGGVSLGPGSRRCLLDAFRERCPRRAPKGIEKEPWRGIAQECMPTDGSGGLNAVPASGWGSGGL